MTTTVLYNDENFLWSGFYCNRSCHGNITMPLQCQWIMRTLTCKHKTWGENLLYLRPYLKPFSVFNVLETCTEYFFTIDLGIVEFIKKFSERFLEKCEIFGHGPNYVQKLYQKQPFSIKPLWDEAAFPKLIIFLKYQRIVWLACYFTVFMILKTSFQNISKTLS